MPKYSFDLKLKIVKEYLEGPLGYTLLAKKYDKPSETAIKKWVKSYQAFGEEGLRKKRSREFYSIQLKRKVLHYMKQTGASYQETAIAFQINEPALVGYWQRTFLREGIEGLQKRTKGRSSMSKKRKSTPSKQEMGTAREKQLERENELLRLENAYLKKLKAFQENPNASLEKHKQRWHSSSKKKDSN